MAGLQSCSPDVASPRPPATATLPPGCFRLSLGAWSGSHEAPNPPTTMILMDSVGTNGLEQNHKLLRQVPIPAQPGYWMYWDRTQSDSLRLSFTGGFVGVQVFLERHESTWDGHAEAWHDIAPPVEATASASLSPMACPP